MPRMCLQYHRLRPSIEDNKTVAAGTVQSPGRDCIDAVTGASDLDRWANGGLVSD